MTTARVPPIEDVQVATDAALRGDSSLLTSMDLALPTIETVEDWLDDLSLDEVLAREYDEWNGECDLSNDGEIVVRDHRGFERIIEKLVCEMLAEFFPSIGYDLTSIDGGADRYIDRLVWNARNIHSGEDTEICCECNTTLIHCDPYSGRAPSVFVDGEGFMCNECCAADPALAMYYAAMAPELFSGTIEDFAELDDESLYKAGWRRVVVDERSVRTIDKKQPHVISYKLPRGETNTSIVPDYLACEVWFNRDRLSKY